MYIKYKHGQYPLKTGNCLICKKELWAKDKRFINKIFCSRICHGKSLRGIHPPNTPEIEKRRIAASIKASSKDELTYDSLHKWIRRKQNHPKQCEHCGVQGKLSHGSWTIDNANKSGKYLKDLSDWLALCSTCHKKYDIGKPKKVTWKKIHKNYKYGIIYGRDSLIEKETP